MAGNIFQKLNSRELGSGGKMPVKTSINLADLTDRDAKRKHLAVSVIAGAAVFALFMKLMVFDQIGKVSRLERQYLRQKEALLSVKQSNLDYEKVRAQYSHYGNGYLDDEEAALQDRLQMLETVEEKLLPKDALRRISINGNVMQLTVNSDRLRSISEIVAEMEARENVAYVTVSSSVTDKASADEDTFISEDDEVDEDLDFIGLDASDEDPDFFDWDAEDENLDFIGLDASDEDPDFSDWDAEDADPEDLDEGGDASGGKSIVTTMTIYFKSVKDLETDETPEKADAPDEAVTEQGEEVTE